jgi:hypothetical protein
MVHLSAHKRKIRDYVIWRPLLTFDAPVVVVMNEQAGAGREHVSRHKRRVMEATVALTVNQIRVTLRLSDPTQEHRCEQNDDEQNSRHKT